MSGIVVKFGFFARKLIILLLVHVYLNQSVCIKNFGKNVNHETVDSKFGLLFKK